MALQQALAAQHRWRESHFPPDLRDELDKAMLQLKQDNWAQRALNTGARLPELPLFDPHGARFSLSSVLGRQPLVLSFFFGHWSIYCNMELRAFGAIVPAIEARGARFLPIVAQSVALNHSTQRCNRLPFPLFADPELEAAAACGLLMTLPDAMVEAMEQLGVDLPTRQGQAVLPMPANYVINEEGEIIHAHIDEDFRQRQEPEQLLAHIPVARRQLNWDSLFG